MSIYFFIHIRRFQLKSIFYEKTKSRGYNNPLCRPRNIVSHQGAAFKALIYIPTLGILLHNINLVLSEFFRCTLETPRITPPSFSCYYLTIDTHRIKFQYIFLVREIQISSDLSAFYSDFIRIKLSKGNGIKIKWYIIKIKKKEQYVIT